MKKLILISITMASLSAAAEASREFKGVDQHGRACSLFLNYIGGKIAGLRVTGIAHNFYGPAFGRGAGRNNQPADVTISPEEFSALNMRQTGDLNSRFLLFRGKAGQSGIARVVEVGMDRQRRTFNYEQKMTALGITGASTGLKCRNVNEVDTCAGIDNAALRNECVVARGKEFGEIPEGAMAYPRIEYPNPPPPSPPVMLPEPPAPEIER